MRNPTMKLKEPKLGKRVPKALTIDELELLRDSCTSILEHALVEFFFATGCRVGEIRKLDRSAMDWQRGCVNAIGKENKEREVYFGSKSRIWLQRYLNHRGDQDAALFVTERKPHRMSIHPIEYIFNRMNRFDLQTKISPTSFAIPSQPYCSIRERPSWPCSPFWAMRNR